MQPNMPTILSADSQKGIVIFHNQALRISTDMWSLRSQYEEADRAYMRELDNTTEEARAKLSNIYGDPTKFRNVTVPIVLPQVEGHVVYQSSVFLTGHPIIASVGSPEYQQEAMQMNSVIEEQQIRGGWIAEFQKHFRNGAKYNLAAMEVCWSRIVTTALETDITFSSTEAKPTQVIWEGNQVRNLNMYNTFWDTRVLPMDVPTEGEFAGYIELKSRVALKLLIASLPSTTNVKEAFESSMSGEGYSFYTPVINQRAFYTDQYNFGHMDWMAWVTASNNTPKINYKDMYEVTTLYARIIPADFKIKVPSPNTPQIWKFIVVNSSVIIYAELQTNAHNMIPILFTQPNTDDLGYQTKSLAENVMPMQALASALWNANIAARRRAISDRGLYNPSLVDKKHIENEAANAKIPVRPSAYQQPLSAAYFPIPYRDDQAGTITAEAQSIIGMANMVSGQNQVRQGQFVKGNKTQTEFETVMGNANGRDQIASMLYEAQLFTPLKEIIKLNILQYQGGTSIYNRESSKVIEVDPLKLRKAVLSFKMSDGLLPTDKVLNADTLRSAMQVIATSPQIGGEYNIGQLFSYLMSTAGADLKAFEKPAEQRAYEQAVGAWQQTVIEALKQGASKEQLPPQPTPQQFNYVPSNQGGPQNGNTQPNQQVPTNS